MADVNTQTSTINLIENTINHYFDGMINHNAASFEKGFAASATMKWLEDGEFKEVNAISALSEYVNTNEPSPAKPRITSVNVAGDAANVGLEIEYETFTFVDYMHLLKINGDWKIVSKTYTTISKEF